MPDELGAGGKRAGFAATLCLAWLCSACGGGGSDTIIVVPSGPSVQITKTALPTSVPETGANVQFTISVANTGAESFTIDVFTDSDFNLATLCPTALGAVVLPAQSFQCVFNQLLSGVPGTPHANTASVTVSDGGGTSATVTDGATVTFLSLTPDISVTKTPLPTSVLETGGNVQFTIVVTSNGVDDVTIDSLTDSDFNLATHCPTAVGTILSTGQTFTCIFTENLSGSASGPPHQNTVTAQASAGSGTDSASANATVNFTDVLVPDFVADDPTPGANTISMQEGPVAGTDFDVQIVVTSVASFSAAAFHVQFDPAKSSYTGFTPGPLLGSGLGTQYFDDLIAPGEIAISANLQGTGLAGIPSATGLLVTLHFEAIGSTAGDTFDFPAAFRDVQSCPTAGQPCTEISGTVGWLEGTLVVN